jgi:hypothetical protein
VAHRAFWAKGAEASGVELAQFLLEVSLGTLWSEPAEAAGKPRANNPLPLLVGDVQVETARIVAFPVLREKMTFGHL